MAKGKFWHDGLSFSCHGCGHCCTFPGGFVYGSEKEFRRIAEYLDLPFETFLERYTRKSTAASPWFLRMAVPASSMTGDVLSIRYVRPSAAAIPSGRTT